MALLLNRSFALGFEKRPYNKPVANEKLSSPVNASTMATAFANPPFWSYGSISHGGKKSER